MNSGQIALIVSSVIGVLGALKLYLQQKTINLHSQKIAQHTIKLSQTALTKAVYRANALREIQGDNLRSTTAPPESSQPEQPPSN